MSRISRFFRDVTFLDARMLHNATRSFTSYRVKFLMPQSLKDHEIYVGSIKTIKCKQGDSVAKDSLVMDIETAKVVLEERTFVAGTITSIDIKPDQDVVDGTLLYTIRATDERAGDFSSSS